MHIADHYTSSYEILLGEFWRTKGGLLDVMIFVFVLAQTTRTVVQVIKKKLGGENYYVQCSQSAANLIVFGTELEF